MNKSIIINVNKYIIVIIILTGIFGVPIASFGSPEVQLRGSLYLHVVFWGGLPPHLLQAAALNSTLSRAAAHSIGLVIKAEVDPEYHIQNILDKVNSKVTSKPALITPHHPIEQEQTFKQECQRAAVVCNIHQHSTTCYKGTIGKTECRMALPRALVNKTSYCQIQAHNKNQENLEGRQLIN